MIAHAEAKNIRISPFKVRPVIPLIKGKHAVYSRAVLLSVNKKGAFHLRKVLDSAIANAKVKGFDEDSLIISRVIANPGPAYKRYRPAAFGRATVIQKRTSHIKIELDTTEKLVSHKPAGKKR
ncbi:MAG: 50S ribosomal protein L22 [Candidatus Omnitrophica bacterium]|nr:50S ribosomal protein L22 [Candidatus Omnitrophota bacterium]